MVGALQPLSSTFAIVDENGKPTDYFIRFIQKKQEDIGEGITAEQALAIIEQFTADHPIAAGTGITLTPSGDLADNITIAANIQALLNGISTTRGSVLYRGASNWSALGPGTAGQVLQTNGAAADPTWVTPTSGGGALTLLFSSTVPVGGVASIVYSSIPSTYKDLIISVAGRVVNAAAQFLLAQCNADTTGANYRYWGTGSNNVTSVAVNNTGGGGIPVAILNPTGATAGTRGTAEATLLDYTSTTFFKNSLVIAAYKDGAADSNLFQRTYGSEWRSTAAITSLTFLPVAGTIAEGTKLNIYGRV